LNIDCARADHLFISHGHYDHTGGPFYLDPEGRRIDPIEDDLALWIRTGKGLLIWLGCCHAGLINTLHHILHLNPVERIHAVIGGFHMLHADNDRLHRTLSALRRPLADRIIACHCTGDQAVAMLRDNLGERVFQGAVGKTYGFGL
jgi:7,8-dihydropterin-6-yl-methyl-4-(beta-D-ribofuranosyl)aminobenzene 5'-phosphate synthase